MSKYMKFIEFIAYKPGRTLDECAAAFGKSVRTIQRWVSDLKRDFPDLPIEHLLGDCGTKRLRYNEPAGFAGKAAGRRDLQIFWSLKLAAECMRCFGLRDDADAIESHGESLIAHAPRAHRNEIDRQVSRLRRIETVSLGGTCQVAHGVTTKLRLASLYGRRLIVYLEGGDQIVALVDRVQHGQAGCVYLVAKPGERPVVVQLDQITTVIGVDDLLYLDFLKAA